MTVKIECTQVAAPTSGGGTQDITISGFGTVKAYLCIATSATANATAADHMLLALGVSDGTNQAAVTNLCEHGVAPDTYRSMHSDRILYFIDGSGAGTGQATHNSFITDGIRINWTDYPPSAYLMKFVFFGGSSLSAVVGNGVLTTTQDTEQTFTTGHQSDQIIFISHLTTINTNTTQGTMSIGLASRESPITQAGLTSFSTDAGAQSADSTVLSNNRVAHNFNTSSVWTRAGEITAFGATSFGMTKRDGTSDFSFCYLSLSYGGAVGYKLSHFDAPVDTGSESYTWPGFKPQFVLTLLSFLTTVNTVAVTESTGAGVMGLSAISGTSEWTAGGSDEDALATTNSQSFVDSKAVSLCRGNGGNIFTATGPSGSGSFDTNGYTLDFTTSDGTARKWAGIAVEEVSTGTISSQYYYRMLHG